MLHVTDTVLFLRRLTKLDSAFAPSLHCGVARVLVRSCYLSRLHLPIGALQFLSDLVGKVEGPKYTYILEASAWERYSNQFRCAS